MAANNNCNCGKKNFKSPLVKNSFSSKYDKNYVNNMMADNILKYISLVSASFKIDELSDNEKVANLKNAIKNVKTAAENIKKGSNHLEALNISIENLNKAINDYIKTLNPNIENDSK